MIHSISESESDNENGKGYFAPSATAAPVAAPKPRKRRTKEEIAAERKAKVAARAEKAVEREAKKALRPGECLRFVEASVSTGLVEEAKFGASLLAGLRSLPGLNVRISAESPLVLPADCGLVRWRRRETMGEERWSWEPEILVILQSHAFLSLTTGCDSLDQVVDELTKEGRPAVIVLGKVNKRAGPRVLTLQHWQETAVRLQLRGVTAHLVDEPEELSRFVRCFSKAVGERHIKAAARSADAIFGTSGASTVSVKVTEDSSSVSRLWRQQLLQLRHVTGEVADALVAAFPTPRSLADALAACEDEQQARKMVSEVEVRRGAGLLQTKRKVGKEAARRLWQLMTSDDPDAVIR